MSPRANQRKSAKEKPLFEQREELILIAARIEKSYKELLKDVALADANRPSESALIRRAIREFLERQGKLPK